MFTEIFNGDNTTVAISNIDKYRRQAHKQHSFEYMAHASDMETVVLFIRYDFSKQLCVA